MSVSHRSNRQVFLLASLAVFGLFSWCGGASATPLVTDQDVATSPPWTATGDAIVGDISDTLDPNNTEGTDGLFGSTTGTLSYIGIPTIDGATYEITFDLAADTDTFNAYLSGGDATVDVTFGGSAVATIDYGNDVFPASIEYVDFTEFVTGDGNKDVLTFASDNLDGTWYLDAVSVTCVSPQCSATTAVPEPPEISVILTALALSAGFLGIRRWSQRRTAAGA